MDWESLYCPNRGCRYYGRPFLQGQLVKNGSSHGQKQARCGACETPVSIRYGTAGGSTVNRGHEHHRLIRCCSAREGRPRRFGGTQRDSGT